MLPPFDNHQQNEAKEHTGRRGGRRMVKKTGENQKKK
jgi:hypothetical protein